MPRLLPALLAAAFAAFPAQAEEFRSAYSVSFMGISVARSEFTTTVDANRFAIQGKLRTSGMAKIFDETVGTVAVTGSVTESGMAVEDYRLDYADGDKKKRTAIRFSGGRMLTRFRSSASSI